jgi:[NiFe] hydrogenase assembly HybE family chaperone
MQDLQAIAKQLEQTFEKIHLENMQGIPILNPNIRVEAVGFREIDGRVLGIIICPWLMNVVLLPREDEDWSGKELGHKQPHEFSSRIYKFMINEYEGVGTCQTHSLHSPMRQFSNHEQALKAAQDFLDDLGVERELTEEERVDEELLGKVLREEDIEVNLDDFDVIQPIPRVAPSTMGNAQTGVKVEKKISRRNLLRGKFS